MTPEFYLTSLVIIATPGTGAIYTVAAGLSGGKRAGFIAAFGCTMGIIPHMIAAISGLAALLYTSVMAFQLLKYLGVIYLIYMAWVMFHGHGMLSLSGQETDQKNQGQVIRSAILINVLNPKLSIFFFAFLPQFVSAGNGPAFGQMLKLSLMFMLLTFIIFSVYGVLAASVRQYVLSGTAVQSRMQRGFAIAFAGLAVQLAFTRQ